MTILGKFFILCSGANREILDSLGDEYRPTAINSFIGIGGAVFFTSCMAVISATFAVHTFLDNFWLSLGVGLFWGLLIFNLDRYIVSSMRKGDDIKAELKIALPRILIALLFAVVISKPLELAIFDGGIQTKMQEAGEQQTVAFQYKMDTLSHEIDSLQRVNKLLSTNPDTTIFIAKAKNKLDEAQADYDKTAARLEPGIRKLEREIANLEGRLNKAYRNRNFVQSKIKKYHEAVAAGNEPEDRITDLDRQLRQYKSEISSLSTQLPPKRQKLAEYEAQLAQADSTVNQSRVLFASEDEQNDALIRGEIEDNRARIREKEARIAALEEERAGLVAEYTGLIARLEALELLKDTKPVIWWADLLIFLLFVMVETAPVLVKLLNPKTKYDARLLAHEGADSISQTAQDVNPYQEVAEQNRREEEAFLRKAHQERMKIQEDLYQRSLAAIRQEEERRFKQNPLTYARQMVQNPEKMFARQEEQEGEAEFGDFSASARRGKPKVGRWNLPFSLTPRNLGIGAASLALIVVLSLLVINMVNPPVMASEAPANYEELEPAQTEIEIPPSEPLTQSQTVDSLTNDSSQEVFTRESAPASESNSIQTTVRRTRPSESRSAGTERENIPTESATSEKNEESSVPLELEKVERDQPVEPEIVAPVLQTELETEAPPVSAPATETLDPVETRGASEDESTAVPPKEGPVRRLLKRRNKGDDG